MDLSRATRRVMIIAAALVAVMVEPGLTYAHAPTSGLAHYAQNTTELFDWGVGTEGSSALWIRTELRAAATAFRSGNNSASPSFVEDDTIERNRWSFRPRSQLNTTECPNNVFYVACSSYDGNGQWDFINLADNADVRFCLEPPAVNPPSNWHDVQRVALHELGHIAGLSRKSDPPGGVDEHSSESQSYSVMQLNTPKATTSGWATHAMQECDVLALQLDYDVQNSAGSYPWCVDHIPGEANLDGLFSSTTRSFASYSTCLGQVLTSQGRLALKTTSDYGLISNNPLTNRTLRFDRRPPGGSWTYNVTSATASNASGYNWTRTWSTLSQGPITYEIRAHFDGETASGGSVIDTSQVLFTISWGHSC
jgi:hypothetical protein